MSQQTLEAPPLAEPQTSQAPDAPQEASVRKYIGEHPWWFVGIALVLFSAILVLWARTRPGYDPYGWLVWGYQTLHLSLDLGGAPSWKPLPYLFTVPFALTGHYALWLWMLTCVAVSLSSAIFAGRIAYRLTGASPERRYAGVAAAVFAGLAVLGIEDYSHYILSVQSDPMIVAFVLGAIDMHLSGHPRWAFALGVLASLGRPESWPFLGLYFLWAWRAVPSMRRYMLGGLAVIPVMWFGIPVLSGNSPFVAGQLALRSPRALHQGKVIGTIDRFTELQYLPVQLAALFMVGLAFFRRDRLVLALAGGAAVWVLVEIAFALHGWPALPRYVFPAAAVMCVLAGVAVGRVLHDVPQTERGLPPWAARSAATGLVLVLVGFLVPDAISRARAERKDLYHERQRTTEISRLQQTLIRVGGYRHVRNCGEPVSEVEWVSALAWFVHLDVGLVGHRIQYELGLSHPDVFFLPVRNGWRVFIHHTTPSKIPRCRNLNRVIRFR